jgi:palmitoyl-protein thioesterase
MIYNYLKKMFLFALLSSRQTTIQSMPAEVLTSTYTKTMTSTITTTSYSSSSLPVVLLHGVASEAANMNNLGNWIHNEFDTKVFNLEIGNGVKTSIYTPLSIQLNELCQTIYAIDELKEGFNFIGMSQGGLLARGYVERCNEFPVRNLITLVSPHGGTVLPDLTINMYSKFSQEHLSVSNYWRDPRLLEEYLMLCTYLPILNNEILKDATNSSDDDDDDDDDEGDDFVDDIIHNNQKEQMKSLDHFVMVWSPYDDIVNPPESAKFSFFNEDFDIVALEDTELYNTDALGLKYLKNEHKLHTYETNCTHVQHRDPICFNQLYPIFALYL